MSLPATFASGAFLRVVNWHNTPRSDRAALRADLAGYSRRYDPVLPADLDRLCETGEWGLTRPGFLPAFYDGYANHASVAAPVCDELGLTAWFFPPTAFLALPPERQRAYAEAHDIDLVADELDQPALAMTWDQLEVISHRHVLAAHTANHVPAGSIGSEQDADREVREPVRLIEQVTGRRPPAFAWLFGAEFEPDSPAWRAVVDAGVRYAVSNTAYVRIAD